MVSKLRFLNYVDIFCVIVNLLISSLTFLARLTTHHIFVRYYISFKFPGPNLLVSFMSQLYGGRITDSQLTLLCGIIDLVEHGDEFLADKGFPQVRVFFFHAFVNFSVHTISCLLIKLEENSFIQSPDKIRRVKCW